MGFSELIKKFDKIRDYTRDFYIYGFKSRRDFNKKSPRTYDNEKRRIESYIGDYMKWEYKGKSKTSFISVDCANIPVNPLYAAWKSKSFTANDITLHFYILDALTPTRSGLKKTMRVEELTDYICEKSEVVFDPQTVRSKCNEYVENGILICEKQGKAFAYGICPQAVAMTPELLNAVRFFQGAAPFGEIGSYILDNENETNSLFAFKHQYIAHTLDDITLFGLLKAIRENRAVIFESQSERTGRTSLINALPLKIFVSAGTGRRYCCMYSFGARRFHNYRLDYIKSVAAGKKEAAAPELKQRLEENLDKVWGVSFGSKDGSHIEIICMKLYIDEKRERFIIDRVNREGVGGELLRLGENLFLYTKEMFDSNDMSPWIKTFIGRIIALEGTNEQVVNRFYADIERMADRYGLNTGAE